MTNVIVVSAVWTLGWIIWAILSFIFMTNLAKKLQLDPISGTFAWFCMAILGYFWPIALPLFLVMFVAYKLMNYAMK